MKQSWSRQRIGSSTLYLRIILMLLTAFTIFGVVVTAVVYHNVLAENYNNIEGMLESGAENIERTFEMMDGTMVALSGSESISKWRNNNQFFGTKDKNASLHIEHLNQEMQRVLIYNNVWNFDLYDYLSVYENEQLLAYTYTKSYSIQQVIDRTNRVYAMAKDSDEFRITLHPTQEDHTIYTVLKVKSDFTGNNAIYIIGGTSVEGMNQKLATMTTFEGAKAYLVQNNSRIYASSCEEELGNILPKKIQEASGSHSRIRVDGNHYEVLRKKVNNEYQILYMFPKRAIMRQTLLGMETLIILSVVIAIVMVLLLTVMESSYEKRLLKDEAQIRYLQHQMNPHFLFNTLLTIQIKAKMSGDDVVYGMISSLSSLLRAGIYGDERSTVTIEEELKYVEYYLSLQKQRYEERLDYRIFVEEVSLQTCEIPRLSIEPVVENAVIHGIETIDRPALVQVNVTAEDGDLVIHVTDNGIGFDVSKLELEMDSTSQTQEKVGLKNTHQRIRMMYGSAYGVQVVSYQDVGTDVTIRVPKREWRQV